MFLADKGLPSALEEDLLSVCRCGVQAVCQCALRDVELSSLLAHYEGHLIQLCELLHDLPHTELYSQYFSHILQLGTNEIPNRDWLPRWYLMVDHSPYFTFSIEDLKRRKL